MKFTKRIKITLTAGIISLSVAAASIIFASEFSAEDPLISKSYLDNSFLPQITQYIDGKITELSSNLEAKISENNTSSDQPQTAANISYEVITLTSGQTLTAKDGSLEIILRPGGAATVYSEIPSNGIADLTGGTELLSGTEIPINSYCLIPRADGRGIVCTSGTAYVMVRGSYEVK